MIYTKIFTYILIIFVLIPVISAANIDIKTLPNHQVQITLLNDANGEFLLLERLEDVSDENGDISFASSTESTFNLMVFVKENGETVLSEKYLENYNPNENIYLEILPEKSFLSSNFIKIYVLLGILFLVFAYIIFRKAQKISSIDKHMNIELEVIRDGKKVSIGKINLSGRYTNFTKEKR